MKVLIVGDSETARKIQGQLVSAGCEVLLVNNTKAALASISKEDLVVIVDSENGLSEIDDLAASLQMAAETIPLMVAVQQGNIDYELGSKIGLGNIDLIVSNFDFEKFREVLKRFPQWKKFFG